MTNSVPPILHHNTSPNSHLGKVSTCGEHVLRQAGSLGVDGRSAGKCYACLGTTFSFTHRCPNGNGSVRHSHEVPARFLPWPFAQTEAVLSSDPTPAPPLSQLCSTPEAQLGSLEQQIIDAVEARKFLLVQTLLVEFLPNLTKPLAQRGFGL